MVSEFEDMDRQVGLMAPSSSTSVIAPPVNRNMPAVGSVAKYRKDLVQEYHGGVTSLVERLRSSDNNDAQAIIVTLINEVFQETNNLLGNHLIATENGELRDASVISFKRAEVLEKAIKAIQSKYLLEKESGIDIDSPSMTVVFRFFMSKAKAVFQRMEMPDEQIDLFFSNFGDMMENWKKELREEFEMLKAK